MSNLAPILLEKLVTKKEDCLKPGLHIFLNPYSWYILKDKYELSFVLKNVDYIHLDGILMVLLLRFFGVKSIRSSFDMTSIAPIVFKYAQDYNLSVALIGTEPHLIKKAVKNIKSNWNNLNIIYYRHGFFKDDNEKKQIISLIKHLNPDIVVCGMGTPLQEKFLIELKLSGWQGYGYTCGGFFHQTAKSLMYYPRLIDSLHLRWLYRIFNEPHVWKRYLLVYPKAVLAFIKEIKNLEKF